MATPMIGKVLKVINSSEVVISLGSEHGISSSMRFMLFESLEDIIDPDTNEVLGKLEKVKGFGIPTHIQPKFSTVISDNFETEGGTRKIINRRGGMALAFGGGTQEEEVIEPGKKVRKPFIDPKVGDSIKRV